MLKVKLTKNLFNNNLLPLTLKVNYFGYPVLALERKSIIVLINKKLNLKNLNEINLVISDSDLIFISEVSKTNKNIL